MPSILITGASKGFGYELLNIYLKNKWIVFPLVRNSDSIKDIVTLNPNRCFPIIGDVTTESISSEIKKINKATD